MSEHNNKKSKAIECLLKVSKDSDATILHFCEQAKIGQVLSVIAILRPDWTCGKIEQQTGCSKRSSQRARTVCIKKNLVK